MSQHPAIAALLNIRQEMNVKLARIGAVAVQELLQPLWDSDSPISAISWDQGCDIDGGYLFSTHKVPRLLVDRAATSKEYDLGRHLDSHLPMPGVLGAGWSEPKKLIPATRRLYEEKIADFIAIPNDVMQLIFGKDVTVNVERSGRITTGNMR